MRSMGEFLSLLVNKQFPTIEMAEASMTLGREAAETVALQVLTWLAASDELMPVFLGSTGTSEGELKQQAEDPNFLAAVLDFLLMDDAWIVAFCDSHGFPYQRVMEARQALPGGEQVHWT